MSKRSQMYSTHNRQAQVMVRPHPDCRACAAMQEKLEQQIIANAVLRSEVMDLRAQQPRRQTAYGVEEPDYTDLPAPASQCKHGRALLGYCYQCGRDSTPLAWYEENEPREEDPYSDF